MSIEEIKWHSVHILYGADKEGNIYSRHKRCGSIIKLKADYQNQYYWFRVMPIRKRYSFHRFTYECFNGLIPEGMEIDHKDRNKINNNIDNLRLATSIVNCRNVNKRTGSSKYKGVHFSKNHKKWRAMIQLNNKQCALGTFDFEIDAAIAYDEEADKYEGFIKNRDFHPEVKKAFDDRNIALDILKNPVE